MRIVDQRLTEAIERVLPGTHEAKTTISTREGVDRQYNGIMALAKAADIHPVVLAHRVANGLQNNGLFTATVTGPGFINFRLTDDAIITAVADCEDISGTERHNIIIDFGGPNLAKSLHVGHLRSLVIGESLRRILIARGHRVVSDIHLGDWGLPIGMLVADIMRRYPGFPATMPEHFAQELERLYPEIVAACEGDAVRMEEARTVTTALQNGELDWVWKAIREASCTAMLPQIKRLSAHFDIFHGESDAQSAIEWVQKLARDHMHEDEGALIIPVDESKSPLIFRKSDGGYTYAATDLATIFLRRHLPNKLQYRRHSLNSSRPTSNTVHMYTTDRILYVVDKRQSLHFEQVFCAARSVLALDQIDLVHVGFGTVNGADGRPYRTRAGATPSLSMMLDAAVAAAAQRISDPAIAEIVGIAAVKFADLVTHRNSGYVYDLDRMLASDGKTGPYVQYASVRLKKILETAPHGQGRIVITSPAERDLLLTCANFPETVAAAEMHLLPNYIAEYAFQLAQHVARFYDQCEVLRAEPSVQASRLAICQIAYQILCKSLDLLGIDRPERM